MDKENKLKGTLYAILIFCSIILAEPKSVHGQNLLKNSETTVSEYRLNTIVIPRSGTYTRSSKEAQFPVGQ